MKPSGAAGRVVHLDAVEEALSKPVRRAPGRPRRQLRDFAIRQLKRAEKLQRYLDGELKKGKKGKQLDPVFVQAVQTCKSLTDTMMNAIEQIRRADKAEKDKLGGLTEEQLDQVFKTQLARIAPNLDDEARRLLITTWYGEDVAEVLLKPREAKP